MKWKVIFSTVLGNGLEFYDFILYGFLATFIAKEFFPQQDEFTALLLAFSVFASACVVRPISALFFGKMGDTKGRRKSLLLSVNMMCVATFLVGVIPTYNSIGITAAILLVLFRLVQGISVAGEETGAAVYLTEESNKNNRGLMTSFVIASVYFGLLVGSIVCTLVSSILTVEQMQAYGWRIPFLLTLPLGAVASYLRAKSRESTEFEEMKSSIERKPISALFANNKLSLLLSTGVCCIFAVAIYLSAVYLPNFLQKNLDYTSALYLTTGGLLVVSLLCPFFGYLSDKYGALFLLKISCVLFILLSIPIFTLLESTLFRNVVLAYVLVGALILPLAGSLFSIIVGLFPVTVRYSGVTFSFNISMTLFGSSAPIIAHYLQNSSWGLQGVGIYVALAAIISLISATFLSPPSFILFWRKEKL